MKAEDLLQSTNLDDIILGLNIMNYSVDRCKVNFTVTALIVIDGLAYLIYREELTKHIIGEIDEIMKMYINSGYIVRDLRTK